MNPAHTAAPAADDTLARRRAALEAELAALTALEAARARRRELALAVADAPDAAEARVVCVALATACDQEEEAERACAPPPAARSNLAIGETRVRPVFPIPADYDGTDDYEGRRPAPAPKPKRKRGPKAAAQGPQGATPVGKPDASSPVDPWKANPKVCARGFWDMLCSDFIAGHLARMNEADAEALEDMRYRALRAKSRAEFDAVEAEVRERFTSADEAGQEGPAAAPFAPPPGGGLFPADEPTAQSEGGA